MGGPKINKAVALLKQQATALFILGHPVDTIFRNSYFLDIWTVDLLDIWTVDFLDIWTVEFIDVRFLRHLFGWSVDFLLIWTAE